MPHFTLLLISIAPPVSTSLRVARAAPITSFLPGSSGPRAGFDQVIGQHAHTMLDEGRQTFRFETFGSEAFWGDALQLHKAIAGEKNGGVGGGVSPKTGRFYTHYHFEASGWGGR